MRMLIKIVMQNERRCRWGEIDVIAVKGGTLSFVEVKTRRSLRFGTPGMAVTLSLIHIWSQPGLPKER